MTPRIEPRSEAAQSTGGVKADGFSWLSEDAFLKDFASDLPAARARDGLLVVQPFCAEMEGDDHRKERARCGVQNQRCP